jgi:hypothetical protein
LKIKDSAEFAWYLPLTMGADYEVLKATWKNKHNGVLSRELCTIGQNHQFAYSGQYRHLVLSKLSWMPF